MLAAAQAAAESECTPAPWPRLSPAHILDAAILLGGVADVIRSEGRGEEAAR